LGIDEFSRKSKISLKLNDLLDIVAVQRGSRAKLRRAADSCPPALIGLGSGVWEIGYLPRD
jgi:hypothetical protein